MIEIVPFKQPVHQKGIDEMMKEIQDEFDEAIYTVSSNPSPPLPYPYWVALNNNLVIGTIGILSMPNHVSVLKRMMLKKSFRGKENGVAQLLLQTAMNYCREKAVKTIYLGTMEQFKAAQHFYGNNGFIKITPAELPDNFPANPVDTVFYRLHLTNT